MLAGSGQAYGLMIVGADGFARPDALPAFVLIRSAKASLSVMSGLPEGIAIKEPPADQVRNLLLAAAPKITGQSGLPCKVCELLHNDVGGAPVMRFRHSGPEVVS